MKITDVKTFVVKGRQTPWVFVQVYTDEGLIGIGDATNYPGAMHDFDRIEKKLLQALKGCVFSSDVKKWIRIYKESLSDRFAGIRRHIKSE